ncbi:Yip1 member 6 [Chamberlinius hualienensis]
MMADVERSSEQEGFYGNYDDALEGEIAAPMSSTSNSNAGTAYNTLDEPVKVTIMRDLKTVGVKFLHVLYPKQKTTLLKDWDLWGPLMLCIFLAMMLQESDQSSHFQEGGLEFAEVFVIVWLGAVVVTVNSKLLGGTISFFQSVCVLGYCLLAPCIALIICRLILLTEQSVPLFVIRFLVTVAGFSWATYASMAFLGDSQLPNKKALALYPIFLFYFVISWMIISHSS